MEIGKLLEQLKIVTASLEHLRDVWSKRERKSQD